MRKEPHRLVNQDQVGSDKCAGSRAATFETRVDESPDHENSIWQDHADDMVSSDY